MQLAVEVQPPTATAGPVDPKSSRLDDSALLGRTLASCRGPTRAAIAKLSRKPERQASCDQDADEHE
jgi:hypothetical protein